ncbi:hypothetical protein [Enterobacter hormaechei]|uniref:hypothetical protein n=1 Tax=Enterobacter hormaechei TaxID=158836 RepID=UPI0028BB929F|nr:hypothetical protein [Enterobacter hormaechei]MDT7033403.1 hypothetical protein [Enterobacter hormaechei]
MITITKERLLKIQQWRETYGLGSNVVLPAEEAEELARIALASLEAEAVADVVAWSSPNEERTCDIRMRRHDIKPGSLYTAPPAPEFYKIGDATMRHIFTPTGITDVSDMQAVFDQIETVLAGMWQPAPVSVPDEIRLLQSEVTIWKDRWELLRELFREVADALGCDVKDNQAMLDKIEMLQGAETLTTAYKLPEGWVAVPVEPTEDMIVNGFESEPDESFSDEKEWEAYEAMSGCQQAAHRAKLCWAAMIKAAPKQQCN